MDWYNDELTVMCLIPRFLFKLNVSCPQIVAHTLTNHLLRWNNFIMRKVEEESIFSLLGMHDLLVLKYKIKLLFSNTKSVQQLKHDSFRGRWPGSSRH